MFTVSVNVKHEFINHIKALLCYIH